MRRRATARCIAVPVNIHGQNWLFYNTKAVLEKVGAAEPTNWDDVFPALDKLKAAGLIPLAFSGQKNWERNLFNAVLVGQGGPELLARRSTANAMQARQRAPEFKAVAETYGKLRSYVDPGAPGRNWNDATSARDPGQGRHADHGRLGQGRVHRGRPDRGQGIWLHGPVRTRAVYVMGGDVFAFPKIEGSGAAEGAAHARQGACSIPKRRSSSRRRRARFRCASIVDVSSLDVCAQKAHEAGWPTRTSRSRRRSCCRRPR